MIDRRSGSVADARAEAAPVGPQLVEPYLDVRRQPFLPSVVVVPYDQIGYEIDLAVLVARGAGQARGVFQHGQRVQLLDVRGRVVAPGRLVEEDAPNRYGRMVELLEYHFAQLVAAVVAECLGVDIAPVGHVSRADQRQLAQYDEAPAVAFVIEALVMRISRRADRIGAHFGDQVQVLGDLIRRQCVAHRRPVLVVRYAPQPVWRSVEQEALFRIDAEVAEPERNGHLVA